MFSALSQGSSIYLLDKASSPKLLVGEVVGVTQPKFVFNQATVDLKVKVEDQIQEFNNLPSVSNTVTYNGGKLLISETKQGIQAEVEGILTNSQNILNNIETYKQNVTDCENILKQLNPQFAKDMERDDRLQNLENRFDGVESKLDKIFELIRI